MARTEIEKVLQNWIDQALSPLGNFAEGVEPAKWVADNFVSWWRKQVEDSLGAAEQAAYRLRIELARLNDPGRHGECFHELTHISDALSDLRLNLGLTQT